MNPPVIQRGKEKSEGKGGARGKGVGVMENIFGLFNVSEDSASIKHRNQKHLLFSFSIYVRWADPHPAFRICP